MSPKYYETDEFKKLSKKWAAKLKDSGFNEQEEICTVKDTNGQSIDSDRLKTWTTSFFRGRFNPIQYEARTTYFRLAGQFLHDHMFDNKLERVLWNHHANGLSFPAIALLTGKSLGKCKRVVAKLTKVMLSKVKEEDND